MAALLSMFLLCSNVCRLEALSSASKCLLHRLPVQLPFHQYEDVVYSIQENRKPELTNTYMEANAMASPLKTLRTGTLHDDSSVFSH